MVGLSAGFDSIVFMRILITGATGLIGQAFVQKYQNFEYIALTRSIEKASKLLSQPNIKFIHSLDSLTDVDAIINLAGEPIVGKRWSISQKKKLADSRILLTQEIVSFIKNSKNPPKVLINASAIGIYGNRDDKLITETTQIRQPPTQSFTESLGVEWESKAMTASNVCRVVVLRTGLVLSKDGGALKKMLPPFRLGLGGKISSGHQFVSWIHIEDEIQAIHFLLTEAKISGPVNLVSPQPITNIEFTKSIAKAVNKPAFLRTPRFVFQIALGEASQLLTDSQRIMPTVLLDSKFKFQYNDIDTALKDLLS